MTDFILSITEEERGLVFMANTADTADTLTLTANGGYMLYLQNKATDRVLRIEKIMASASTPGVVLRWEKSATVDKEILDNNNIHAPVNINGNKEATEIVCYNWNEIGGDGIVGVENGETIKTFILGMGHSEIKINAVLGAFDNMALHLKHPEGMPEIECGIQFSYQDIEDSENVGN